MQAVANNPKFAKKVGVPQSVGKDFSTADKNRKTSKGGDMKHSDAKMDKSMMKKVVAKHAAMPASKAHKGLKMGGSVAASKMGKVKTGSGMDGLSRVKTKALKPAMKKMARGGKTC
jgi:hypothetical protein